MPLATIKGVKIIAPMEFKLVVLLIIGKYFNIIVFKEPRHVNWIEASTPRVESGSPEVHAKRLRLVKMIYCWVMKSGMTHFMTIDRP